LYCVHIPFIAPAPDTSQPAMPSDIPPEFQGRGEVMLGFAKSAALDGKHFFYIRIPEPIDPFERCDRYEDPLGAALAAAGLGDVTGGGSQLGGGNSIEYCGIDVVVTDRNRGLAFIRETMQQLGASPATAIEEYLPAYREHRL
jgi:hypothetical protein